MRILIACECSGRLRRAIRELGHDAWSCDIKPAEDGDPHHLQTDVRSVLTPGWNAMIAFPDCTYLCGSGLHWNGRRPGRAAKTADALAFVRELWTAPISRIAIENPIGLLGTALAPPSQIVQPYDFGDDASKATCLWLKGLTKLRPTQRVPGRIVVLDNGATVERWANQTASGQNRLGPSPARAANRARTYNGIARAMADQWFGANAHLTGLPLLDADP